MKNAILYARYSPRPGMVSDSCEAQLEKCCKWAESSGYQCAGRFKDEALSGKSVEGREGLEKALVRACESQGTVVVYSLSRLARSTKDAIAILERLKSAGAHLAILDMQIDTSTAIGVFFFTVMSAWAQLEREQISQRTSDSMLFKSSQGKRVGRYARYGWNIDGSINEREQGAIRDILFMHKQGYKCEYIAKYIGIDNRGKKWKASVVAGLIAKHAK